MIEINLLPKELQGRRFRISVDKKLVVLLVVGAAVILGLASYSFVYQAGKISSYKKNIAGFKAEADQFASEIRTIDEINEKKKQLSIRMTAIDLLVKNRDYWVNLMEDVARRVPDYLWLTLVQEASAATVARTPGTPAGAAAPAAKSAVEGYAYSLNAIATFLVRLKKSEMITNIEITSIALQESDKAKAYFFKLTCDFNVPRMTVPTETVEQQTTAGGTAGNQF